MAFLWDAITLWASAPLAIGRLTDLGGAAAFISGRVGPVAFRADGLPLGGRAARAAHSLGRDGRH